VYQLENSVRSQYLVTEATIRFLAAAFRGFSEKLESMVIEAVFPRERVREYVKNQKLLPLIEAVIECESNWKVRAVSHAGAQGLMQLMPAIQRVFKVTNPFDPAQNIRAGEALLEEELSRFQDLKLALAAYNAGSPAVRRAIERAQSRNFERVKEFLPAETRKYVPRVLSRLPISYSPFS